MTESVGIELAERGLVPLPGLRWGVRRLVAQRLEEAAAGPDVATFTMTGAGWLVRNPAVACSSGCSSAATRPSIVACLSIFMRRPWLATLAQQPGCARPIGLRTRLTAGYLNREWKPT